MPRAKVDETRARDEIERLHGYIAGSLRTRRRLRWLIPIGLVATVATWWYDRGIAYAVLVATIATYGAGFYITWAHIQDWRARQDDLDEQLAQQRR
jgi:hypothetical protein